LGTKAVQMKPCACLGAMSTVIPIPDIGQKYPHAGSFACVSYGRI
jgi:hypothetical protein